MLSTYDNSTITQLFEQQMPAPYTSRSVQQLDVLLKELQQVRDTGISLDDGQLREGMYCLGTCVVDTEGQPIAGMAISFVKEEYEKQREGVSQALLALAKDISQRLGVSSH
nr:IclR family transcriptional regulator C-terminal domain-containing protein [Psychrobacter sp. PraFG1]UNK04610.2 hypothetical protein MN210_10110 [Psychrobacter sp. PraFG1]